MSLINLRTNLKSLRFGNDTQGGGASGLPYIQTGLPEDSPEGEYLAGIVRTSADWPLRGGQYWTLASTEDAVRVSRFLTDFPKGTTFTTKQVQLQKSNPKIETGGLASRLNTQTYNLNANLLAQVLEQGSGIHIPRAGANANELGPDNPQSKYEYIVSHKDEGQNRLVTLYNTKISTNTAGLSLDATVAELGISIDDNILLDYEGGPDSLYGDGNTTIFRTTNTKDSYDIYKNNINAINYSPNFITSTPTLLESLNKSFYLSPRSYSPISDKYNKLLRNKFVDTFTTVEAEEEIPNFATNENGEVVIEGSGQFIDSSYQQRNLNPTYYSNRIENDGIYPKGILQGYGGDNLPGFDNIVRAEQSPPDFNGTINQFNNTMAYSALLAAKDNNFAVFGKTQDFRSNTNDDFANLLADSVNYNEGGLNGNGFKIESRIGVGNPGTRPSDKRSSFYDEHEDGHDKINMSPIYRYGIDKAVELDDFAVRDLVKFCIESIDNEHPRITNRMHFRAYITNFSDNIGAEWNAQKYMGRGENFYTYQGFTREVGFTFIVAAQSVQEMEKIYQKVNYLASTLHPDYQEGTGFMRGSLHKLTIGEYFYRTTGVITSMNITVEDNYPWEIKMRQPEIALDDALSTISAGLLRQKPILSDPAKNDRGQMEIPQILKIQMNFKPIAQHSKEGGSLPQKGLKEPIIVSEIIANNYLARSNFDFKTFKKGKVVDVPEAEEEPQTPSIDNTGTADTPAITTATDDCNESPAAATTTTAQPPPADSWVNGEVVPNFSSVISNTSNPASPQTWTVTVQKTGPGFYQWVILEPDGNTVSSAANAYTTPQTAFTDGKAEAENISGYNTPIQDSFNNAFGG